MNRMGITEQVVKVSQNLLVGPNQKRTEVIGLILPGVQRQRSLDIAAINELIDLAVRVTGDVPEHRRPTGPLSKPVDRHNRKELLDGPRIRNRLKQREVTEIGVAERSGKSIDLLGYELQLPGQFRHLATDRPIKIFDHRSLIERQVTGGKEVHSGIERLLGIMVRLQQVPHIDIAVGLKQILHRLLKLLRLRFVGTLISLLRDPQHTEDQHTVVSDHRPAALRNDCRVIDASIVADVLHMRDDVIGIFLQTIIYTRFKVGL